MVHKSGLEQRRSEGGSAFNEELHDSTMAQVVQDLRKVYVRSLAGGGGGWDLNDFDLIVGPLLGNLCSFGGEDDGGSNLGVE